MKMCVRASYGNDSVALIQWLYENVDISDAAVLYSDTGWASPKWKARVEHCEAWAESLGFGTDRTSSIGMEALVKWKKSWPRQGIQFCTEHLKILPAQEWASQYDPDKAMIGVVGVRREESTDRKSFPEWRFDETEGRWVWAPLVDYTEAGRNALLRRAGFEVLDHKSQECYPCVNSNRKNIRKLAEDESRISLIERIEGEMGYTAAGKPRTMFRPYRYMGATGIREIVRWGLSERGKFESLDDETGGGNCDGGYCGT